MTLFGRWSVEAANPALRADPAIAADAEGTGRGFTAISTRHREAGPGEEREGARGELWHHARRWIS
jgi:hypothetical protein